MDENPYKAPKEKDAAPMAREPQNEKFWTVTFCIGAFFWIVSTGGMIFTWLGYDDQLPPDKDRVRWGPSGYSEQQQPSSPALSFRDDPLPKMMAPR
ncbi:MAG TPA: hypothetical protein VHC22_20180 [Pirellulales bacterium]|nr:hypothetical protein [Pirellulales bacterium]